MSRPTTVPLLLLLAIMSGCAGAGWLLGRLIRGRQPVVERSRPRLATSSDFLQAAYNNALSAHTRVKCAFEAIYFCLCEIAESNGIGLDGLTHPSADVVQAGLNAINASTLEREVVEQLTEWATNASPFLPSVSIDDACRIAEKVNTSTISFFSRRTAASPVEV
jgi:hypothetical protein